MDLGISAIVATFGDDPKWTRFAQRALGSLSAQTLKPLEVLQVNDETLACARNRAARTAKGEWLLFVDADDALDQRYICEMTGAIRVGWDRSPTGDMLLQPATLGWYPDGTYDDEAVVIPTRPSLRQGNWMVIGTLVRRSTFLDAGGFWDEPTMEDWSLWLRCCALGAVPVPVPEAIYHVFQNPESRNLQSTAATFKSILQSHDRWLESRGLVG